MRVVTGRLPTRDEFERAHAPASAPRPAGLWGAAEALGDVPLRDHDPVCLETEAEALAAIGLVGREARNLVDAGEPVADGVSVQVHRLGGLGGRTVVGEESLERRQELGVMELVVALELGDRARAQQRELVGVTEQTPTRNR